MVDSRLKRAAELARDIAKYDVMYHSTTDPVLVADAVARMVADTRQLAELGFRPVNRLKNGVPTYKVDLVPVGAARTGRAGPYVRRHPQYRATFEQTEHEDYL